MTTAPDWAGVLSDADLARKVPAACQTCGGSQCVRPPNCHCDAGSSLNYALCPHLPDECPDCPTIADLLRWGYNVARSLPLSDYLPPWLVNARCGEPLRGGPG